MHKHLLIALIFAAALVTATSPVVAGEPVADAAVEQSIAPEAANAAGAVAHDHSETCGGGGSCCAACQIKQKYAKNAAEDGEGGCPCKKAKLAREQAEREAAAKAGAAAPAD